MGYYIQGPTHGKADHIVRNFNGTELFKAPQRYEDIPEGKALIVVVDNESFEAAAFCYDANEFAEFTSILETRPRRYVMDREQAEFSSGFKELLASV